MTVDDFRAIYPSLSRQFVDEQIESNLRLAGLLIKRISVPSDLKEEALSLLSAHLTALDGKMGDKGNSIKQATSKRVGDVQYSYSSQTGDRGWYELTGYGQKLLMLIGLQPEYGGAFVV